MANQTVTAESITVHGRGSLVLPFKVHNASGVQIDISGRVLRFEVDGVPITELLVADPSDSKGQLIKLERTQVQSLKQKPTRYAIVDETELQDDLPKVLWEGVISRTGYVGTPDNTDDA